MLDQLTQTVKPMPYVVFDTNERGPDHGPVFCVGLRGNYTQEITRQQYNELTSLPGHWEEGMYWLDEEAEDYRQTVEAASYRGQ